MDCFAALAMTGEGMAQRLMEVFPPEIQPVAAGPSRAVIARSEATKQAILSGRGEMDCFAALAMTGRVWPSDSWRSSHRRFSPSLPDQVAPSLRGAKRRSNPSFLPWRDGLLRCARNDGRGYGPATHGGLPTGDSARRCRTKSRRHCEERSDEAIHLSFLRGHGLLRCARN